jgi:hypothetical protein
MKKYYIIISILFIIYAGMFINLNSFIAIDGQRYYTIADDALISMRYAWNLSHGNGLVWNHEEYVEGITNPLYTIACSIISIIFDKRYTILIVQLLAMVTLLAVSFTFAKIGKRLNINPIFLFIVPLIYYPLFFWTMKEVAINMIEGKRLLYRDSSN